MSESEVGRAYLAGVGVALLTSSLIVWTAIVRDDGQAMGSFGVIMAAMTAAFATRFRPLGIARAMLGVAVMQVLIGTAIATAPITAAEPDGILKAVVSSGIFTVLWLLSAAFFRRAARNSAMTD